MQFELNYKLAWILFIVLFFQLSFFESKLTSTFVDLSYHTSPFALFINWIWSCQSNVTNLWQSYVDSKLIFSSQSIPQLIIPQSTKQPSWHYNHWTSTVTLAGILSSLLMSSTNKYSYKTFLRSEAILWSKMLISKRAFHKLRLLPHLCRPQNF